MERLIKGKTGPYFENDIGQLYLGDSFQLLKRMVPESVDMIFADPPYFLSNDGVTCRSGHLVSVNKASWDEGMDFQSRHRFNRRWIRLCKRCLSPNGTIWISGTMHNIFSIGMAMEQEGFKIINSITWQKTNPPPNLACRCFTHSTETIIWAKKNEKKAKHTFNYELMKQRNGGHQMKDVWTGSRTRPQKEAIWCWILSAALELPEWQLCDLDGDLLESITKKNILRQPLKGCQMCRKNWSGSHSSSFLGGMPYLMIRFRTFLMERPINTARTVRMMSLGINATAAYAKTAETDIEPPESAAH